MNINEREKNQIIQKKNDKTKKQFAEQRNKCNNYPVRLITKMSKGNKNQYCKVISLQLK